MNQYKSYTESLSTGLGNAVRVLKITKELFIVPVKELVHCESSGRHNTRYWNAIDL